jgi:hypothetical protein
MYIPVGSTIFSVSQLSERWNYAPGKLKEVLRGTWIVGHTVTGPVEFLCCKICPQSTGLRHEEGECIHHQCQLCIARMYVDTPVELLTCQEDPINGLFHPLQVACGSTRAVSLSSLLTLLQTVKS